MCFSSNLYGRTKVLWIDNCTNYNLILRLEVVLKAKQFLLRYLPRCSIHLCQPADTFIVSKIKDAWSKRWEAKKTKLIASNVWQNIIQEDGNWSKKLINFGKHFFCKWQ